MAEPISPKKFRELTRGLVGMSVSLAWRGYGTAIFLELGELHPNEESKPRGEATAMLEWDWRVEKQKSISFGSGSYNQKIKNGLQVLVGQKIVDVELEGRLPELVISLSGSLWVHTFTIYEKHPEWTLFLPDGNCLSSRIGRVEMELCDKRSVG
jgi:hypothetical protein